MMNGHTTTTTHLFDTSATAAAAVVVASVAGTVGLETQTHLKPLVSSFFFFFHLDYMQVNYDSDDKHTTTKYLDEQGTQDTDASRAQPA